MLWCGPEKQSINQSINLWGESPVTTGQGRMELSALYMASSNTAEDESIDLLLLDGIKSSYSLLWLL